MTTEHRFALRLDNLTVRHGPGCSRCRDAEDAAASMERNRCPRCGTIWALRNVSLRLRKGEILGGSRRIRFR